MKNIKFPSFIFIFTMLILFIFAVVIFPSSFFKKDQFNILSSNVLATNNAELDSYKKSIDPSLKIFAKLKIERMEVIEKNKKTNQTIKTTTYQVALLLKKTNLKLAGSQLPQDAKNQLLALVKTKITPQALEDAIEKIEKQKFQIWHALNPLLSETRMAVDNLTIQDIDLKDFILTMTVKSISLLFANQFKLLGPKGGEDFFKLWSNFLTLVIKDYDEVWYQQLKSKYKSFLNVKTTKDLQLIKPVLRISKVTMNLIEQKINADTSPLILPEFLKILKESWLEASNNEMERINKSSSEESKNFKSRLGKFPIIKSVTVDFDTKTLKTWLTSHNWWYEKYKKMFSDPKDFPKIKLSPKKNGFEVKVNVIGNVPSKDDIKQKNSNTFDNYLTIGLSVAGSVFVLAGFGGFLYWFFKIKK